MFHVFISGTACSTICFEMHDCTFIKLFDFSFFFFSDRGIQPGIKKINRQRKQGAITEEVRNIRSERMKAYWTKRKEQNMQHLKWF